MGYFVNNDGTVTILNSDSETSQGWDSRKYENKREIGGNSTRHGSKKKKHVSKSKQEREIEKFFKGTSYYHSQYKLKFYPDTQNQKSIVSSSKNGQIADSTRKSPMAIASKIVSKIKGTILKKHEVVKEYPKEMNSEEHARSVQAQKEEFEVKKKMIPELKTLGDIEFFFEYRKELDEIQPDTMAEVLKKSQDMFLTQLFKDACWRYNNHLSLDLSQRLVAIKTLYRNKGSIESVAKLSTGQLSIICSKIKNTQKEKKSISTKNNAARKSGGNITSNHVEGIPISRKTNLPMYGYARDKFGRVQTRDQFNEERLNDFRVRQDSQRNYDYSNHDANDDHDGYYDLMD